MKYLLADGEVKFLSNKVEWQEKSYTLEYVAGSREVKRERLNKTAKDDLVVKLSEREITPTVTEVLSDIQSREFWSAGAKDNFISKLSERDVTTPVVTEYEQPTQEVIDLVTGKKFSRCGDVQSCIEGEINKSLEQAQAEKLQELWVACNQVIEAGFTSNANGDAVLYGFDQQDQGNLTGKGVMIANGLATEPIYWKGKGETDMLALTIAEFKQLLEDGETHKMGYIQAYMIKKAQVQASTTKEEVKAIVW